MNSRHLLVLGLVFLTLLAINVFQKAGEDKVAVHSAQREEWRPLIPAERIKKISFSKSGGSAAVLEREPGGWKVQTLSGADADTQKINILLGALSGLKAELRAEGEELYGRFGVAENQAFRLQLWDDADGAVLDFYMGAKRAGQGVFIRLPGKPKIYFVPEELPAFFGLFGDLEASQPLPIFFTNLRLVPESFEQIQRFEVTEFKNRKKVPLAVLERPVTGPGTPWQFVAARGGFLPGFNKIESYLGRLIGAHAENIADSSGGFETEMEIMLRDDRGKVLRLEFSRRFSAEGKGQARWLARREKTAPIFEVSNWVFEDLKTDDARLVEANPLQIQIDETYLVELKDEKRTEVFSKNSGWPSAAAILDALSRLAFVGMDAEISAKDLAVLPPTHRVKIMRLNVPMAEIGFYVTSPGQREIKAVISGQDMVYLVSRAFFESIFIPELVLPE